MRDYRYVPDDGPAMFVADMPTWQIEEPLQSTLVITDSDGYSGDTVENVKERLRIELVARNLKD